MDKVSYKEISAGEINSVRSLVISECSRGGYTLGQKVTVDSDSQKINVFLKGAIHIDDLQGLKNIRDAFNKAISEIEN